jgi:O-acetyl-ADP-ribose deacetylase (regulator of RNase III)
MIMNEFAVGKAKIMLVQGDITKQSTDAIVNAANSTLMGGGGVDGAIHRAGGPAILDECMKIVEEKGQCPTGEAVITTAGNMPSKYVIHTVGPVWRGGNHNEPDLLASCYRKSLEVASQNNLKTISFPSISTGAYRYPVNEAANVALHAVIRFLQLNESIEKVLFVLFDGGTLSAYEAALDQVTAPE